MTLKVCVIGAGAAGLCAGRHMVHSPETYDFVIFEQTSEVGGTWNYTERTERDEFNLPIHSSMYQNLRTNVPKEIMGYPDFPFPNSGKSFTHHTQVLKYLKDYANHHGLYNKIKIDHTNRRKANLLRQDFIGRLPVYFASQKLCDKNDKWNDYIELVTIIHNHQLALFLTHVKSVTPLETPGRKRFWKVIVQDFKENVVKDYEFDAIMVCNGHFAVPYIPTIENIEEFQGMTSHSHSYRKPEHYKDKTVVVLGAGSSGIDIAIESSFYAREIYLSHNHPRLSSKIPKNIIEKVGIKKATKDGFVFMDDSFVKADVLIYCTGYMYDFPFLTEECKVKIEGNRVMPLYKHLIHMDFPELCFIGLPFTVLPFPFFHYQVIYFLKTLDKSVQLPNRKKMEEETEKDYKKRIVDMKMPPKHAHKMGPLQWEYFEDLGTEAHMERLPPVYKMIYDAVEGERKYNVMFYKKENYRLLSGEEYVRTMPEP